jgi:hypothetical protein
MIFGKNATVEDFKKNGIPIAKQQTPKRARAYLYATYLAFVTGRRNAEIIKSLELIKKKNEWYYKGITKKGAIATEIKAFSLDEDFNFLTKILKQIRNDVDVTELSNTEVNSKYNHIFNRAFKRITATDFTTHDAREIYAEIAYINHIKATGEERTERAEIDFKSDILGHVVDKDRLVSTEFYMTKKAK